MKFKIEKELKWVPSKLTTKIDYYIWVDSNCIAVYDNEDEARNALEIIKVEYKQPLREIIHEEEI
jgi:hypothetical protein